MRSPKPCWRATWRKIDKAQGNQEGRLRPQQQSFTCPFEHGSPRSLLSRALIGLVFVHALRVQLLPRLQGLGRLAAAAGTPTPRGSTRRLRGDVHKAPQPPLSGELGSEEDALSQSRRTFEALCSPGIALEHLHFARCI